MLALLFTLVLPLLAALPALARLVRLRRAYRFGLVRRAGWRWLLLGLAAAQATVWLAALSLLYPTRWEMPLAALAAVAVILASTRQARPHIHPGLRGLRRPPPRDGLDLIEREQQAARQPAWRGARLTPAWAALPAWLLIAYIAAQVPERALGLGLLALLVASPLLIVPYRWQWLLPLGLALPVGVLISQAITVRASLPPGWWAHPISAARCPGLVRVAGDPPRAWCVEALSGQVTAFDLGSGLVTLRQAVPEVARLFATNGPLAWVQQNPAQGVVRVSDDGQQPMRVSSAQSGAADSEGRLWVIDVSQELSVYAPDGTERRLRSADGLLNNTASVVRVSPAGDVWVGSFSGLSRLRAGSDVWQTIGREAGVPGAIHSLAFGPEGSVWVLWQPRPGYSAPTDWGLSVLDPAGAWVHRPLGAETQLELSLSEDPLAIDALGRAWFVTQSLPRHERLLGVAAPGLPVQVYSLSSFSASGPYAYSGTLWRDTYGVVSDRRGGIVLYTGDGGWWRWRPFIIPTFAPPPPR